MALLREWMQTRFGKDLESCSDKELYYALLALIKERAGKLPTIAGGKKLYYISAEFLLGKLLSNNLINLGLYREIDAELKSAGRCLTQIEDREPEPSLGNGGLGRLAACFLDSIATLGLHGDGIGLNYHFGLFKQLFRDYKQVEEPNPWIEAQSWLRRDARAFTVPFGKYTLQATLFDIDVIGYQGGTNKLRLFDIDSLDEGMVKNGISFDKQDIPHNLTLFLYPDDSDRAGHLLRVYQQYFLVSCAAQLILQELEEAGHPLEQMDRHAVIQINDTHPAMIIPELIRLLTARGIAFDRAVELVSATCAYTNHTILAEALEKWPVAYIEEAAPQLVPILRKLDVQAKAKHSDPAVSIIDGEERVHMAHLAIHYGFSINGVAALHTEILKTSELQPFYKIYPKKFNNKTNGITFRRWLMHVNPRLEDLLVERIGDGWRHDALQLEGLLRFADDEKVLAEMLEIKQQNKQALKAYLQKEQRVELDENAVFDIQIKRLHEYKRQQMNALYAIYQYKQIKAGHLPPRPLTMIFGGKAAPAYVLAKDIIHLILCLGRLIDSDPEVRKWLRIVMVENYNVTMAEKLIPACDISEQISLASKEASGTGNMKFMLNGAVTLGTMDGANVEIHDLVGKENIFIFGKSSKDVIKLYEKNAYRPTEIYRNDGQVRDLVDFILSDELRAIGDFHSLFRLYKDILTKDWFMALLDLSEYIHMKDMALQAYEDRRQWAKRMLVNTAKAGYFSADRTIAQYNDEIWHLPR